MRKREAFKLAAGVALAAAARPRSVSAEEEWPIAVEGDAAFQSVVGEALALLASIHFTAYVAQVSDRIVGKMPNDWHAHLGGYGWVDWPPDQVIRNTSMPIYVAWPLLKDAAAVTIATVITHEATHLHQFRRDPAIFMDEVGPTSVQYAVETALTLP